MLEIILLAAQAAQSIDAAPPETRLDPATPARMLRCTLAKATNIDLSRDQHAADIQYAGSYPLTISLPAAKDAQKIRYRVLSDPTPLFASHSDFERVADRWPQRVELAVGTAEGFNFAVLSEIDAAAGKARIFVGRGSDAANLDPTFVYGGSCALAPGGKGGVRG